MELKVTYDRSVDAAYIYLTDTDEYVVTRTIEAVPEQINLDFDRAGRFLGIEVLDAKHILSSHIIERAKRI